MKRCVFAGIVILTMLQSCASFAMGPVRVETVGSKESPQLIVENGWIRIAIDPARGGRIGSYIWKGSDCDWIVEENSGLLLDHVTQQKWPGELMNRPYHYTVLESTPEKVSIRLTTTIVDELDDTIRDVKFSKVIAMHADSPVLDVSYRLENPTTQTKSPTLWIQNILAPGGYPDAKFSFRPTTLGPLACKWGEQSGRTGRFEDDIAFRFDPTGGWIAQLHSPTQQGLVFLVDYNFLKCLYCCYEAMTTEWWYELTVLPPGREFVTSFQVLPVFGLESIAHASPRVIGELQLQRQGQTIRVQNRLMAAAKTLGSVDVRIELIDYLSQKTVASNTTPLEAVDKAPQTQLLQCDQVAESTDLVARVTVTGPDVSEQYERFDCGAAIIGTETRYRQPRPIRDRPIFKPEKIVKARNATPGILHLRGLFEHYYRWPQVNGVLGGRLKTGSYTISIFGPSLSYFPITYDELMGYDLIVVNNVPADGFGEEHLEYLQDFATHGGVILFIGGPTSFAAGGYQGSRLEQLLPVLVGEPFDMGIYDSPLPLDAMDTQVGFFQHYQTTAARTPDARIILGDEKNPIVITRRHGQGVVAFFTPLALGTIDTASGFWEAENYPRWMADVVQQLLQMTDTYAKSD